MFIGLILAWMMGWQAPQPSFSFAINDATGITWSDNNGVGCLVANGCVAPVTITAYAATKGHTMTFVDSGRNIASITDGKLALAEGVTEREALDYFGKHLPEYFQQQSESSAAQGRDLQKCIVGWKGTINEWKASNRRMVQILKRRK